MTPLIFYSAPGSVYLQVILMVGLPGSGKTQWALKYSKENPEKRYNVLGAETVLNQMRVSWPWWVAQLVRALS